MNVRIFWVRAMECMCAQTSVYTLIRKSFRGMESETRLTLRGKSPLPISCAFYRYSVYAAFACLFWFGFWLFVTVCSALFVCHSFCLSQFVSFVTVRFVLFFCCRDGCLSKVSLYAHMCCSVFIISLTFLCKLHRKSATWNKTFIISIIIIINIITGVIMTIFMNC